MDGREEINQTACNSVANVGLQDEQVKKPLGVFTPRGFFQQKCNYFLTVLPAKLSYKLGKIFSERGLDVETIAGNRVLKCQFLAS